MLSDNKFKFSAMSNFLLEFPIVEEINLSWKFNLCQRSFGFACDEWWGFYALTSFQLLPASFMNSDFDVFAFSQLNRVFDEIKN